MPELSDHLSHLLDGLERRCDLGPEPRTYWSSAMPRLDALTGGPGPGGWLIRGEAGSGTSALIVAFVVGLAFQRQRPVVHVVTTDLSPDEVTLRLVARAGGISVDRLRSQELLAAEWRLLSLAFRALSTTAVRITDARAWSQPELELWCVDQRPAEVLPVGSWLVIDRIDRLSTPGIVSLPRLERLSGRYVAATTHDTEQDLNAAAIVTTIRVDAFGHRTLEADRSPRSGTDRQVVGISLHPTTLRSRDIPAVMPGPGQLRLDGMTGGSADLT